MILTAFLLSACVSTTGQQNPRFTDRAENVSIMQVGPDSYTALLEGLDQNEIEYGEILMKGKAHEYCKAMHMNTNIVGSGAKRISSTNIIAQTHFTCYEEVDADCSAECYK